MYELLFFIVGLILGGLIGVAVMCLLQINRLRYGEGDEYAKSKRTDTFPTDR